MHNHLMPVMLGLAVAVVAAACGENSPPPEETDQCSCECTTADPVPHCVNTQDCRSTADCPTGTVCGSLPSGLAGQSFPQAIGSDPLAACGSSSPSKRCQLPAGTMGRQTLNTGFEVPAFYLLRFQSGEAAAFTWNPPEETHVVHCALFACPPVITETVHEGRPIFRIKNYEQCVLAAELYEPGEGVFDLGDPSIAFPAEDPSPGCASTVPRTVTELAVGCWAYDKSKIIAATPLEPISPAEVFNFHDRFDLTCEAGVDGRTCALSTQSLGVCVQGTCRPSCVTKQDCSGWEEPSAPDGGADGGASDPPEIVCFKSGGYVGVCLPATETTEVTR